MFLTKDSVEASFFCREMREVRAVHLDKPVHYVDNVENLHPAAFVILQASSARCQRARFQRRGGPHRGVAVVIDIDRCDSGVDRETGALAWWGLGGGIPLAYHTDDFDVRPVVRQNIPGLVVFMTHLVLSMSSTPMLLKVRGESVRQNWGQDSSSPALIQSTTGSLVLYKIHQSTGSTIGYERAYIT